MDLSVIIPARNEEHRLGFQLDALLAQEWGGEWEIVVVDNGSTDGTADLVERYSHRDQRVKLVGAHEHADKSYAMNLAVQHATADAIAFCDADDEVASGWVAAMADGLSSNQVVTGPNELDKLNPPWLAETRGRSIEDVRGSFVGMFPCIRGNNFGVTRGTWTFLDGMNMQFHPVEDIEFSMRCWLNDIEIVGLPKAVVHYRYRDTARVLWRQGFAYGSHRPAIARLLKDAGKPMPPKFSGWKSWMVLLAKLPTVATRSGRAAWLWIAGNRFGQVVGSVRCRVIMI
jgi:glycosyltransferase involved in cell wall biosynthesis